VPSVSIITIVRNNDVGLARTRASVAAQACRDFEWILVDGASTDVTRQRVADLLRSGEARGISEPDGGIYDAMNKGLRLAAGDYVLFLNAGDRLLDAGSLGAALAAVEGAGRPDVAFFASQMDFGNRVIVRPAKQPSYIWHGQPGLHQATFVKRTVHLRHPFRDRFRVCGDYDVLARIVSGGASLRSFPAVVGVNEFDNQSTSGRFKLRLMREALAVQRTELKLPLWKCAISLMRRGINSAAFKLMTLQSSMRGAGR
jgi:putative colanic acid biosynthesis glycosyltransferase